MFKSVDLTSPPHHGSHAAMAQHLLQQNRWETHFYQGPLDGVYGERTAAATRRAKFYLGFPRDHINGGSGSVFGKRLHSFLVGPRHPDREPVPPDYKVRMKKRKHELPTQKDWHDKIIGKAKGHLHETEHPAGSNQTRFNSWYYGQMIAGPWCAMFASYCIHEAGGPKWFKYAYCPYILRNAAQSLNGMHVTHSPGAGAVVLYDWDNDHIADHVEFFMEWITEGSSFQAIGGNTGPSDFSNGGQVYMSTRYVSDVIAFIRVP